MSSPYENRNTTFFWSGLKTVWELLDEQRHTLTLAAIALFFVQVMVFSGPYLVKVILDRFQFVSQSGYDGPFMISIILLTIMQPLRLWLNYIVKNTLYFKGWIRFENEFPKKLHAKLMRLSARYHERETTGKKIAKITRGCDRTVDFIGTMFNIILPCVFFLVINMVIMLWLEWRTALIFFIPLIFAASWQKRLYDENIEAWDRWQNEHDRSASIMSQGFLGIATVHGYVQEQFEIVRFGKVRDKMEVIDLEINLPLQRRLFMVGLIQNSAFVGSLFWGLWLAYQGEIGIGILAYLVATGGASIHSLQDLIATYSRLLRDLVSIQRLRQLLAETEDVPNHPQAYVPQDFEGTFQLSDVSFRYNRSSEEVLRGISLTITPGSMVAFVGPSGSGKTTIVKVLARAYDRSHGSITLDRTPIEVIDRDWYRRIFATVQQRVDIFDGTLRENITYGCTDNVSDEELTLAIRAAHLEGIANNKKRLPQGLETHIGERGVNLSGGEQQRVGIARAYLALLHGARVLILDEATSSLDSGAERAIQEMVDELRKQRSITIIAIAHRLSTIQAADHIYVLGDGAIIEEGDHAKLLKHNGLYASLVNLQSIGEIRED